MNNINVRVVGTANVTHMVGGFAKVQGQVTALNAQLAQMVALQNSVDPRGYERMAQAAALNSKMFRNAAASSGMFEVQQLKVNRATDDYVKRLNKQQMSFRELAKARKVATAAYKEQLAMENMVVRQNASSAVHGKQMLDVVYPKQISNDLDTAARRLAWFNAELKSGAHQMVNWGKNTQWAGRQLMVGFTMPVAAFGAAAGVMAYQVDKELTRIAKVYDTTADQTSTRLQDIMAVERELAAVREQATQTAINAAREYGSAGTDTLNVQAELAATGLKGAQLQEYTNEVMRISTLGELEYADSIQATISMQSVFRMSTQELTEAFNYMNAVENATSLQTKDFAAAIPIAAAPVKQFGGDIKELGILLAAMKERGIEATQGANAIKAAMQRLGRPSAQVQAEWEALTGTDITRIFEDSTSLLDLFSRIREATRELDNKDQIKAFAGLFGTYQVTRMSALVEGMDDLAAGTGQVSAAMRLAGEDASNLAKIAENELAQQADSISGRWDRAFQEMKLQISTLGEPFLEIATVIVKGVSWIIEKFNELPGPVKIAIAGMIGLGAIAGPLVMLTGLFANLVGQTLKMTASILSLGARMKIIDSESRAAALATELAEQGFLSETRAVQQLTRELNLLAMAQGEANRLTGLSMASSNARAGAHGGQGIQYLAALGPEWNMTTAVNEKWGQTASASGEVAENTKKTHRYLAGTVASTSAMAAGMLLTATNSNEVANAVGNWLIIGSMVVPAVQMLAPLIAKATVAAWGFVKAQRAAAASSIATAGGWKGAVGGAAGALRGLMNPVGLTVAAVAAVGVGIYAWKNHLEDVEAEQARLAKSVNSMADKYAEAVGLARKEWEGLTIAQRNSVELSRMQEKYEQYKSGDLKKVVEDYNSDDLSDTDRDRLAAQHFMELQVEYGLTAQEAAENTRAMLAAAGRGLEEQDRVANQLLDTYGKINQTNIGEYIKNQIEILNTQEYNTDGWKTAAEDAASVFALAFNDNMGPGQAQELIAQFSAAATTEWGHMFSEIANDNNPVLQAAFTEMGYTSAKALREAVVEAGGVEAFSNTIQENIFKQTGLQIDPDDVFFIRDALLQADEAEREFFGNVSKGSGQLGMALDDNINTLEEFTEAWIINSKTLSYKESVKEAKRLRSELKAMQEISQRKTIFDKIGNGFMARSIDAAVANQKEQKRQIVNQMNLNYGYKQGETLAEAIYNLTNRIASGTNNAAGAARNLASAFSIAAQEAAQIQMAGMQNVQQSIADAYRDDLEAQHEAQQDAMEADHENRQNALEAAHERQQNAFDARWERRTDAAEAYWDKRIEGVEKAIEAEEKAEEKRQAMFEAEIARIQKLNEMANANIDFNVALNEGDLDEAARIRNDAVAKEAQTVLEREAGRGAKKSERRIENLNTRRDQLEKERDKYMEHLQKMQDAQSAALQRRQEAESNALQERLEAEKENLDSIQEAESKSLEQRLDLFLAYIAQNKKDLKNHMDDVGLSYKKFGRDVLKPMGEEWGTWYGDKLRDGIRSAGLALKSDKIWEELGKSSSREILKGMGFDNMSDFKHFINTGEMRHTGGKSKSDSSIPKPGDPDFIGPVAETRHEGGEIGSGGGSRKGVARTQRGLHHSETMVRAQKGEFVVNRESSERNRDILHRINNGEDVGDTGKSHGTRKYGAGGGGFSAGPAAAVSGALGKAFSMGVGNAMRKAYDKKKQEMKALQSMGGVFAAGKAGMFSDRFFGSEQLRNAAIIASVGSRMGMSIRDIMIGIMTAITESGLINVNYGDRDSLGLFQQRPSMGWGTPEQVTDPEYASRKFFEGLRGVSNRADLSPWLAAQAVQRSAYSDGSNYRQYWDNAQAIFKTGLTRDKNGNFTSYAPGAGGWSRPVPPGYSFSSSHDIGVPVGTPVFAVGDGKIVESRYITSGGSPGNGSIAPNGQPYRSYGEVIKLATGSGTVTYAHLMAGSRMPAGRTVKGGTQIARSGNTGNSTGPHLHLDVNGAEIAQSWLAARGVHLNKGAARINFDNTVANLHKGEAVLTEDLNRKFHQGVENFANGGNNEYNINVTVANSNASADEIANAVISKIERQEARKPRSRRA